MMLEFLDENGVKIHEGAAEGSYAYAMPRTMLTRIAEEFELDFAAGETLILATRGGAEIELTEATVH